MGMNYKGFNYEVGEQVTVTREDPTMKLGTMLEDARFDGVVDMRRAVDDFWSRTRNLQSDVMAPFVDKFDPALVVEQFGSTYVVTPIDGTHVRLINKSVSHLPPADFHIGQLEEFDDYDKIVELAKASNR
tara:strand:- start:6748 stop:7137 length:390 start_codon:yes stop_codon:yes gene_type:complete